LVGDGGGLRLYFHEGVACAMTIDLLVLLQGKPEIWFSGSDDDGIGVSFSLLGALFVE
jgi:hypothetical protein